VELAAPISDDGLDLEALAAVSDATAVSVLEDLRGIGRWSAEYALVRGLGRVAVCPGDDVGTRNNLQRLVSVDTDLDDEAVGRSVAPWASYSGLIYFHLLLDRLDETGLLPRPSSPRR